MTSSNQLTPEQKAAITADVLNDLSTRLCEADNEQVLKALWLRMRHLSRTQLWDLSNDETSRYKGMALDELEAGIAAVDIDKVDADIAKIVKDTLAALIDESFEWSEDAFVRFSERWADSNVNTNELALKIADIYKQEIETHGYIEPI